MLGLTYSSGALVLSGLSQDRRGHLEALKFGQCSSQFSEFYSSFSQLCVCRQRDRFMAADYTC